MSNPLDKVFRGEKFRPTAQLWNLILDAVRYVMDEQNRAGKRDPSLTYKYFRITDSAAVGVGWSMWTYTADEVVPIAFDPSTPDADRYAPKAGGLVDSTLYNDAEERDPLQSTETFTGEGGDVFGNGVDPDDLPDSMSVQPIPTGRVVRAWYTLVAGGAEWRFDSPNGVTGPCEEPES